MLGVWVTPGALETLHKGGGLEVTRHETGKNVFTDFKFEYPGFFDDGHCNYFGAPSLQGPFTFPA